MEWKGSSPSCARTQPERLPAQRARQGAAGSLLTRLTKTELAVLELLNLGLTNQEIASKRGTTVGTIKWYLNQIFSKLQVRNRVEALACAGQHLVADPIELEGPRRGATLIPLSEFEVDILSLVQLGLTDREIASSLALTKATTRSRISRIFAKLQARNRIEALTRAGWIEPLHGRQIGA